MWNLFPGNLLVVIHKGLYRYVSRGTAYQGRWWLGIMMVTMLMVLQVGIV